MTEIDAKGRRSTAFRIPVAVLERLDIECDQRCVGRNLIVTRAIEDFLDRLPSLQEPGPVSLASLPEPDLSQPPANIVVTDG